MNAVERVVDALRGAGCNPRKQGSGWSAKCPAHDDQHPSLSIAEATEKKGAIVNCNTGCPAADVVAALGLTLADLFDEKPKRDRAQVVARYPYVDAAGKKVFEKVRFVPKDFRVTPAGAVGKLAEVPQYRLDEVRAAVQNGDVVHFVEGEKDADRLRSMGLVATTTYAGAWKPDQRAKWRAEYAAQLAGASVVVIADDDPSGHAYARHAVAELAKAGVGVAGPLLPTKGSDISEHLDGGGTLYDLDELPVPVQGPRFETGPIGGTGGTGTAPGKGPRFETGPIGGTGGTGTAPVDGAVLLDDVRAWLARFITVVHDKDLDVLTLWAVHTHVVAETYTTPRLVIDSPVPGSGKTTCLEHLHRLCVAPVQIASISSPALLTRILEHGMRTLLIDEADRSLAPDKPGVGDLIAVLNSGYKRGATRPVLTPVKGGGWETTEMPTFAPVAMAGNNPTLPEDTRQRCLRVLLLPDLSGRAEDSDWELIEGDVALLAEQIAVWAVEHAEMVAGTRPELPDKVRGRAKERWLPLARVGAVAGGRWAQIVPEMALEDVEQWERDMEDGMVTKRPHILLLEHLNELWPAGQSFAATSDLVTELIRWHPETWGDRSAYGRALTVQRFGRMMARSFGVNSSRENNKTGPRGYYRVHLESLLAKLTPNGAPVPPVPPIGPVSPPTPSGVDR